MTGVNDLISCLLFSVAPLIFQHEQGLFGLNVENELF